MFFNDPTLYGVSIPRESSFVNPYYAQWQQQFPWSVYGQQIPFYGQVPMYGQQFQLPYFMQQGKFAPTQWEQPYYGRFFGQMPYTPFYNVPQSKWQHHFTY